MTSKTHGIGFAVNRKGRALMARGLAGLCLSLCLATTARAASFTVNPVQVFLTAGSRSALVTIRNETDQPLRFQLSVVNWNQAPDGQMQTSPTQDVVIFPPLLTLQAKEERKIRVGVTVPPGSAEKTYRMFVEELPTEQDTSNGVRMLTKMGIPIFLAPTKATGSAALKELAVKNGHFGFRLENGGTVHIMPQSVRVVGLDAAGLTAFEQKPNAWYILAGGVRIFDVEVPAASCAQVHSLAVEARLSETTTLKETLQTPGGACGK
jgi:fimbrial chaperone protein